MQAAADLREMGRLNALDSEFVMNLMVAKLPGEIIKMKYIEYGRGWTRDLRGQFLRFETETETEQVQSQQARPRLKRYSLNKRDRD